MCSFSRAPPFLLTLATWWGSNFLESQLLELMCPSSSSVSPTSFDRVRLLDLVDHDLDLLREIVVLLFEDTPVWLEDLEDASEARDGEALRSTAHALKGALGNFAADRASQLAASLEKMGRNEELEEAPAMVEKLIEELATLSTDLESMITEG